MDLRPFRPQLSCDTKQGNQAGHHQDGVDDGRIEGLAQQAPDGRIAWKIGGHPGHISGNWQAESGFQSPRERTPLRRNGRHEAAAGNDLGIEGGHDLVMRYRCVARHVSRAERDDEARPDYQHAQMRGCPGRQAHCAAVPGSRQCPSRQRQQQSARRDEHRRVLRLHQRARHRIGRRELELLYRDDARNCERRAPETATQPRRRPAGHRW